MIFFFFFQLCSILFFYILFLQFIFLTGFIIDLISVMLEYRSTSDGQVHLVRGKKQKTKLRPTFCDVNGISLFLPVTSKEKLVVTPCSTQETAHSRLPTPQGSSSMSQCFQQHHCSLGPPHVCFRAIGRQKATSSLGWGLAEGHTILLPRVLLQARLAGPL